MTGFSRDDSPTGAVPVARLHHLIWDCVDPQVDARFWSALLGHPITYADDTFVVVAASDQTSGLAFQLSPKQQAPTWPDPRVGQQAHLDVMVEDPAQAAAYVLGLGARPLGDGVYADPSGHPFCLIRRPGWAPPLRPA